MKKETKENRVYRIAVCDDEKLDKEEIVNMAKDICQAEQIPVQIDSYDSAGDFLDIIQEFPKYDLLLLDVLMPDLNGMELAKRLRQDKQEISIIFISCSREMALQGYEVSAVRYLAKPLVREELQEAIHFCYEQSILNKGFLIPVEQGVRRVSLEDICYVEINGRKARIVQQNEEWDTALSMTQMEELLPSYAFIRCHQSFLVNCHWIRMFLAKEVELENGKRIPVSKHRVKDVRKRYFDYMNY